ncbi:MAG: hypothetical protein ACP5KZ_03570 [bacterium]
MLKKVSLFVISLIVIVAIAQAQPETTLAGITVGKSWDQVLNIYGQPDEILVGLRVGVTTQTGLFPAMMPSAGGGMPGMPGMMGPGMMPGAGGMPEMMGPGMMPGSGMPGMMGPGMMPGGMPGMMQGARPGMGMPGMMGSGMGPMPGMRPAGTATPMGSPVGPQGGVFPLPGFPSTGGPMMQGAMPSTQVQAVSADKVVWIYRLKGGITLRVTLAQADGRVVEVSVSGLSWAKARTSKGITLGSSLMDVLKAYGWPEEQSESDGTLFCRYDQSYHIVFGLKNKKVVSITVSM